MLKLSESEMLFENITDIHRSDPFSLMLQDREWNSVCLVKHFDIQKHLLEMCFSLPSGIDEVNIHKVLSLEINIRGNSCAILLRYDDAFSGICTYVDM